MKLPGWSCRSCSGFNGESKEILNTCRACGALRPPELAELEATLARKDLTSGERAVFAGMQRAVEIENVALTSAQAAWLARVSARPVAEPKAVPMPNMSLLPRRSVHPVVWVVVVWAMAVVTYCLLHR